MQTAGVFERGDVDREVSRGGAPALREDEMIELRFEREDEKKNSVRYREVPEEGRAPVLGTIYVQKWVAGDAAALVVTIDRK